MDFDFSTQEGWKKAIVALAGILGTVLTTTLGWSPDKANVLVTLLVQFSPMIGSIAYFVVNQIAAKGKAAAKQAQAELVAEVELTKAENISNLITASPIEAARVMIAMATGVDTVEIKPKIELIKDQISIATEMVAKDPWAFIQGDILARFNYLMNVMLVANPELGTIDAVRALVQPFLDRVPTVEECGTIQSVLGLGAVVKQWSSQHMIADFMVAIELNPALKYLGEDFKKYAISRATNNIVNAGIAKVMSAQTKDELANALMSFGYTETEAYKTTGVGGNLKIFRETGGQAGGYADFNPWGMLGIDR